MPYIEQQDILDKTHGGLDIIIFYYPQAAESLKTDRKEFKLRESERTPSARLKKLSDGNWVVTDFGDDQVPRNGIQVCMREEEISYREAIVKLASRYGVGGINPEINKPGFEKRPATAEEEEGNTSCVIKEMTDKELLELGPLVTKKVCDTYNVYSLESFTYIKNREAQVTTSNENYPIFMRDLQIFKKIFQPKNPDKAYRFRYAGAKPKEFVNGLTQVEKAYRDLNADYDPESDDPKKKRMRKLEQIIRASGERDALNLAGLGFNVIWFNSESESISPKLYLELTKMAEEIYNLPDIDSTGKKQAIKLGLQYLDIKTIWLPAKLSEYKDHRGNSRKDFRDYVDLWPRIEDFLKLMRVAMPMRFWDEVYTKEGLKYFFNNVQAYSFLQGNGFFQFENKNEREGMMFIHMNNNIIKKAEADDCMKFMQNFMKERFLPTGLRNMLYRSNQLGESSLRGLDEIKLDFTDYDKQTQYLFFVNHTWKVTAAGITELKPADIERYVWEEEVIPHKVGKRMQPFSMKFDNEDGEYDIEVLNNDSDFFKFLINASRIHWKEEYIIRKENNGNDEEYLENNRFNIAGKRLDQEEIWEQKQHLINKIFSIGYLLHRYKDPARPWCVFAMDNKITETGESHGRSGKSVCYKTIRNFMKSVTLNGRNPKLTENPHVYDRVTEHTDYVLIDDADQYLNFGFFFNALQGDLEVNPKNNQSYEIPFENVPKFCITSNFTLRNIDPSTEGRILYTVFSDYYHVRTEEEDYESDFTIRDDFGKNLFNDYTEEEWNNDFNFFANCLQFYLSVPREMKLNPPMDNVTKRNLRTEMTEAFLGWAAVYFDQKRGNCDNLISRDVAFKDFAEKSGQHKWSMNKFSRALKAWAKYTDYVDTMNPPQLMNSAGRIIRKIGGTATEMVFMKTRELSAEQIAEALAEGSEMEAAVKLF